MSWWERSRRRSTLALIAFVVILLFITVGIVGALWPTNVQTNRHSAALSPSSERTTTTRGAHALAPLTTLSSSSVPSTGVPTTVGSRLTPLTIRESGNIPTYSRSEFGNGWIDADHDCQNTRAEVLIRQSSAAVGFTTSGDCTVASGRWTDPWSGAVTTLAHTFDIDHTVPLANAWRSGASSWTAAERVDYANDLIDADHLLAISASDNRSKGDRGPDLWKPPQPSSWCRYALEWDRIKVRWHLTATRAEWDALVAMAATCNPPRR
jgi:hypothetical protein